MSNIGLLELCLTDKLNDYLATLGNKFVFKAKHSTNMCILFKSVVRYYNH